ncbi:MAG: prepilin peptidase [Legionellales bacterium]|nr:prepilin peptidase [Legionellales bacterium]
MQYINNFFEPFFSPWGYALLIIFALIIGSFLSVVIYRFPKILFNTWHHECTAFLAQHPEETTSSKPFNLCWPSSHCPKCKTPLKPWQNIPVIGYLLQRGKCHTCHERISFRYPLIELTSAAIAVVLFYLYGWSWTLLFGLIFSWGMLAATFIDIDTQILPDQITLSLIWLGLLINTHHVFVSLDSAVYGAVFGYLSLWLIAKTFLLFTKREGMGHGDFKLLAVIGAWAGWEMLLPTLLIASFVGAIVGIAMIISGQIKRQQPIPFGPFLAGAGWICLFWGSNLLAAWNHW